MSFFFRYVQVHKFSPVFSVYEKFTYNTFSNICARPILGLFCYAVLSMVLILLRQLLYYAFFLYPLKTSENRKVF